MIERPAMSARVSQGLIPGSERCRTGKRARFSQGESYIGLRQSTLSPPWRHDSSNRLESYQVAYK